MTVYLDLVIVLNFLVDFLLLLGTNRLSGYSCGPGRCGLAAAFGGLYGGVCILPGFRFLGNAFWRVGALLGIAVCAFGVDRSAWRRWGIFLLLSMALGGVAVCLGRGNAPALVLGAGGLWLLCRVGFGGKIGGQEYVNMLLSFRGNTVRLTGLRDSGNTLRDPISGGEVFVIGPEAAERLTGLTRSQLRAPLETLAAQPIPGLRLIPFHAVGGGGMLLGLRLDDIRINGHRQSAVVAFSGEAIGQGGGYQALVTA